MNRIGVKRITPFLAALVAFAISCSDDEPTRPVNGIITTVSLEDHAGEFLDVVLRITNNGSRGLKLAFGSTDFVGYRVSNTSGVVVAEFPPRRTSIDAVMTFSAREEKIWRMQLLKTRLLPGRYVVSAGLLDHEQFYPWATAVYVRR